MADGDNKWKRGNRRGREERKEGQADRRAEEEQEEGWKRKQEQLKE